MKYQIIYKNPYLSKNPLGPNVIFNVDTPKSNYPIELDKLEAEMRADSILSLPKNYLNALDLIYGMSVFFNKDTINPSRDHIASKIDVCTKTVTRATNRLDEEGIIKKTNEKVSNGKECRNKFTELDVGYFKSLLHFIKKHNRKKYALLVIAFTALRVINISSVPEINFININNTKSINSKYIYEGKPSELSKSPKSLKKDKKEEKIHTRTTPVLPSDMVMDWVPATKFSLKRKEEPLLAEVDRYSSREDEAYNEHNIGKMFAYDRLHKKDLKEKGIDLRYCQSDEMYRKLSSEDKKIAHHYYEGLRRYGSLEVYEETLKRRGLHRKIWRPVQQTREEKESAEKLLFELSLPF